MAFGLEMHPPVTVLQPSSDNRHTHLKKSILHASEAHALDDHQEDLETLARASEVDSFSYLLGDELPDIEWPSSRLDGHIKVEYYAYALGIALGQPYVCLATVLRSISG
ncbi:uncharacterized protein ARMOST_04653 [Armillaria ostoyae]|uniref:Uncharacterized protein n=1 Tax=Armillaria ostoyae TaxID=47428 RepID=A0A284QXX7_ARMOS|nr:uncharacterized protein ARMOST_04653 [Armillaria ostoyae]